MSHSFFNMPNCQSRVGLGFDFFGQIRPNGGREIKEIGSNVGMLLIDSTNSSHSQHTQSSLFNFR